MEQRRGLRWLIRKRFIGYFSFEIFHLVICRSPTNFSLSCGWKLASDNKMSQIAFSCLICEIRVHLWPTLNDHDKLKFVGHPEIENEK